MVVIERRHPCKEGVIILRERNPDMTLDKIGRLLGVSKERVRQVLDKEGLATRATHKYKYTCKFCGKILRYSQSMQCGSCRVSQVPLIVHTCAYCGKTTTKRFVGDAKRHKELRFCNKLCQGSWLAKYYGVNPGEVRTRPRGEHGNKYDYTQVLDKINLGKSAKDISKETGVPVAQVYYIAHSLRVAGRLDHWIGKMKHG